VSPPKPVIDADAHVVEPHDIWLQYLDEPLRDLASKTPGLANGNSTGNDGPESLFPLGFITEMGRKDLLQLAADPASRLKVMDSEGIDRVALFPTHSLRLGGVRQPKLAPALFRAYNDWLAEHCAPSKERLLGVAMIPLQEPEHAVKEAERAVTKLGHRGVGISVAVDGKPLDHPDFAPLFEATDRLGVPMLILPNHPSLIDERLAPYNWLTGAFGFQVDLSLVALRLLCAGVLDRHPKLQVILGNLGGVFPFILERLDQYWERVHAAARPLPVTPTEALRRFYLETASAHPAAIRMTAEVIGIDRLVFGSDYPSFDFRRAVEIVRNCGLPPDQIELVLSGNAKRLLDLDQNRAG